MGDLPARWFPLPYQVPNPTGQKLAECRARFVAVDAARRSLKTEISMRRLILALAEVKPWDTRYFYAAPTREQAKTVAWESLKLLIPLSWVRTWDRDVSETELSIRTKFGARLCVVGLDRPERIEGVGWDGGVVDESSDVKPEAIRMSILPALADKGGWLWRIGVPKRDGVGSEDFRAFCENASRDTTGRYARFTWIAEEVLTEEQLCDLRMSMSPDDYMEQFGARWLSSSGQIFSSFDRDLSVRESQFNPELPVIVGCDFNVNPMAWGLGHLQNGVLDWFDELWLRDTTTVKTLDTLWQRYGSRAKVGLRFFGDATGRARRTSAAIYDYQAILDDKRFHAIGSTIHFPKANPQVVDRVACANAAFCNANGARRVFVSPRCRWMIADLQHRGYKSGTREPADSGDVGHMTDAITYAMWILFRGSLGSDRADCATMPVGFSQGPR